MQTTSLASILSTAPRSEAWAGYRNKTGLGNTIDAIKVDGTNYTLTGSDARLAISDLPIYYQPEPATLWLLVLGGLAMIRRRRA